MSTGLADSASVATNLLKFADSSFPTTRSGVFKYLFPDKAKGPYPLAKFLILCILATVERDNALTVSRAAVAKHVTDPWMTNALREIHRPWFE